MNSAGYGIESGFLNFTMQSVVSNPVQSLQVLDYGLTFITIGFTTPSFNGGTPIINYSINFFIVGGPIISQNIGLSTSFTAMNLPLYTLYTFRVYAKNAKGNSTISTIDAKTCK